MDMHDEGFTYEVDEPAIDSYEGGAGKTAKLSVSEVMEPGFMDPKLWENLQRYIPLKDVFARLPLREFFQLRLVCREWNCLAGDREFLLAANPKPIQKPYFHLRRCGDDFQLHGLLTYTSWSREWNYACLGHHDELANLISLEGLIYTGNTSTTVPRVFNIHSRVWHTLPPLIPWVQSYYDGKYRPVVAMKVDTSTHPYEFQIIRTGSDEGDEAPTQTYDSRTNTWELSALTSINDTPGKATCAQVSDAVYVRSDVDDVFCYKTKEDCWYAFNAPIGDNQGWLCGVGAWKEKVYHISQIYFGEHPNSWFEIIMYVDEDRNLDWEEFDRMPHELRDWLSDGPRWEILTSYCDECVLIWSYLEEVGEVGRFVLYNVETKTWERACIPDGLVQPFMVDGEETKTWDEGYHCWQRKKSRQGLAMELDSDDSSDGGEVKDEKKNEPATLDEWSSFLDSGL